MATWYIRPTAGSDASAGSSYATALQTVTGCTAGKGLAAGDEIRIESNIPSALSSNATWTNGGNITLGASVTQMIADCETAWTASANVTATASASAPREGTKRANIVIAAAFTTGLVAYFPTGTLDLSGYKQVSFWFATSVACAAGDLVLKLCTDTAGATPVTTISIPAVSVLSQWVEVTVDTGGSLNSAIKSIALYQVTDIGAVTIQLDNILACKDSTSADALTLHSLIGKNTVGEPQWYAVRSINGTTITLDPATAIGTTYTYYGTTETVQTYRMEPWDLAIAASVATLGNSVQVNGTTAAPITVSGGWTASSSMASQSGVSAFSGRGGNIVCYSVNLKINILFNNLVAARGGYGFQFTGTNSVRNSCTNCQVSANSSVGFYSQSLFNMLTLTDCYLNGSSYGLLAVSSTNVIRGAFTGAGGNGAINTSSGIVTILGTVISNNIQAFINSGAPPTVMYGGTVANNTTVFNNSGSFALTLNSTVFSGNTTNVATPTTLLGAEIHCRNYNNTPGDHRIFTESSTTTFDTATFPTGGAGGSWKLSPTTTNRTAYYPMVVPIKPGPLCRANQPVTINGMYKRDNTNITASVVVKGGHVAGISTDQISTLSASAGTWATFAITVTPTETAFLDIELQCYDGTGTTNSAWFYLLPPG